ncbi:hypothetical protein COCNU_09G000800 [Cocos nucifera]|uniref:Uncharacterized protein n=1 Tax=Cocos nucifera TaxID=13894 RepID=A0A8K0N6B7_COCNU|nr:hypothetical protein COCNU_09G000800 [Cocos nucifera]
MKAMSTPTLTTGGDIDSGLNVGFTNFGWKRVPLQLQTSTGDETSPKPQLQLQRQYWLEMRPPPSFSCNKCGAWKKTSAVACFGTPFLQFLNSGVGGLLLGINPAPAEARPDAQPNVTSSR